MSVIWLAGSGLGRSAHGRLLSARPDKAHRGGARAFCAFRRHPLGAPTGAPGEQRFFHEAGLNSPIVERLELRRAHGVPDSSYLS